MLIVLDLFDDFWEGVGGQTLSKINSRQSERLSIFEALKSLSGIKIKITLPYKPFRRFVIMAKGQVLQDPFLNILRKEKIPVSIFLVNGIKLQGHIESFDQFVILLRNTISQMVYKHAISTVVPSKSIRLPASGINDEETDTINENVVDPRQDVVEHNV